MNLRLFARKVLIATRTDVARRLGGAAIAFFATMWTYLLRSSLPPGLKFAAVGLLAVVAWELFWICLKYYAYSEKSLDSMADGYSAKNGMKIIDPPEGMTAEEFSKTLKELESYKKLRRQ